VEALTPDREIALEFVTSRGEPGIRLDAAGSLSWLGERAKRGAAKNWLHLLRERAGVTGRLIKEGQPARMKASRRIPSPGD
jgi:hypothetical protein